MITKKHVSKCCKAELTIVGTGEEFHWVCTKCHNPADPIWLKVKVTKQTPKGWEKKYEEIMNDNTLSSSINGDYYVKDYKELKDFIKSLLDREKELSYIKGKIDGLNRAKEIYYKT